ncbi:MAG: rhomboid family intramembrane serine protease [Dehalococcoidia bacterium]|jgi:membrane associated rhomboid family serine protease
MYLVRVINPDLAAQLGLFPPQFWDRPWTLVTCMFIHANLWHIIANMITLYFFGSYLNRLLGTWKFLAVYFAGGMLGSIVFLLLPPDIPALAVGASGAIFALGGVLAVMRPKLRVIIFPIPAPLPLWIAIIGIFAIFSFLPNVAWQAHAGGLALGLVLGYILRRRERRAYY